MINYKKHQQKQARPILSYYLIIWLAGLSKTTKFKYTGIWVQIKVISHIHFHLCFQESYSFLKIVLLVFFFIANEIQSEEFICTMLFVTVGRPSLMLIIYKIWVPIHWSYLELISAEFQGEFYYTKSCIYFLLFVLMFIQWG